MRDDILAWAEKRLNGRRVPSKQNAAELTVEGHAEGSPVAVQASRSSHGGPTMMLRIKTPDLPLLLSLRRRERSDQTRVLQGAIHAVTSGDAAIDSAWLMEAAPAALATEVVDSTVRARIAAVPACSVLLDQRLLIVEPDDAKTISDAGLEAMLQLGLALRARVIAVHQARRNRKADETADRREAEKLRAAQDQWWARASWPSRAAAVAFLILMLAAALAYVRYSFFPS